MPGLSKEEVRRFSFGEFFSLSCSWISLSAAQVRFSLIAIRP
jgi:hypothetical protein